jgi:phosphotransferase system  glucose/maltose/N-acetylglucosamine-specific IIC component
MADVSKQFSLREIVGTVAPGAMVLVAVLYVASLFMQVGAVDSGWAALLIFGVISYGVGTLLTSLTESVFATVTKLGTPGGATVESPAAVSDRLSDRIYRAVDRFIQFVIAHLSGGQDITKGIKEFRETWHVRAVPEQVVSAHTFDLATMHYRTLFDDEPAGEESLLICEYYIRERMPAAMQEIEQNAARAALLGNLIVPMLAWMAAALAGALAAVIRDGNLLGGATRLVVFGVLFALFPYVVNMIGSQWTDASRNRVKIVVLSFVIACRLGRPTEGPTQAGLPAYGV